jgi:hypothetical protein
MEDDPLIAQGWENIIQIASLVLLLGVIGISGFLSRKLEGALFFSVLGGGSLIVLILILFVNSKLHIL